MKTKENRGLTVQINLWPTDNGTFNTQNPELSIRGQVKHIDRKGKSKRWFSNSEELGKILVEWNTERFEELSKNKNPN
jgi:hypothetical protein